MPPRTDDASARLKWLLVILALPAAVFWGGVYAYRRFNSWDRLNCTFDTALLLAHAARESLEASPQATASALRAELILLHDASVSNGVVLSRDGEPVDLWGNPFQVLYSLDPCVPQVTALSAGPDGAFDSGDDIAETEQLSPAQAQIIMSWGAEQPQSGARRVSLLLGPLR